MQSLDVLWTVDVVRVAGGGGNTAIQTLAELPDHEPCRALEWGEHLVEVCGDHPGGSAVSRRSTGNAWASRITSARIAA